MYKNKIETYLEIILSCDENKLSTISVLLLNFFFFIYVYRKGDKLKYIYDLCILHPDTDDTWPLLSISKSPLLTNINTVSSSIVNAFFPPRNVKPNSLPESQLITSIRTEHRKANNTFIFLSAVFFFFKFFIGGLHWNFYFILFNCKEKKGAHTLLQICCWANDFSYFFLKHCIFRSSKLFPNFMKKNSLFICACIEIFFYFSLQHITKWMQITLCIYALHSKMPCSFEQK